MSLSSTAVDQSAALPLPCLLRAPACCLLRLSLIGGISRAEIGVGGDQTQKVQREAPLPDANAAPELRRHSKLEQCLEQPVRVGEKKGAVNANQLGANGVRQCSHNLRRNER